MQTLTSTSFLRWTTTYVVGGAVCQAVFVALIALALKLPIQNLGLPYLLLVWCGYIGGVLIYRARQSHGWPRSPAIRFALAIFLFSNLYMGALVFSAYNINLLSRESALYDYGPYVLPGAALTSIVVYIMARRRLEAP